MQGAVERLAFRVGVLGEEPLSATARLLAAAVLDVDHVVRLVPTAKPRPVALRTEMRVLLQSIRKIE